MKYSVKYTEKAIKDLRKLDPHTRKLILSWIGKNLVNCEDPRAHGKGLIANHRGEWRYRIGDYCMLAEINDNTITILVLTIGNRREIYN